MRGTKRRKEWQRPHSLVLRSRSSCCQGCPLPSCAGNSSGSGSWTCVPADARAQQPPPVNGELIVDRQDVPEAVADGPALIVTNDDHAANDRAVVLCAKFAVVRALTLAGWKQSVSRVQRRLKGAHQPGQRYGLHVTGRSRAPTHQWHVAGYHILGVLEARNRESGLCYMHPYIVVASTAIEEGRDGTQLWVKTLVPIAEKEGCKQDAAMSVFAVRYVSPSLLLTASRLRQADLNFIVGHALNCTASRKCDATKWGMPPAFGCWSQTAPQGRSVHQRLACWGRV